MEEGSPEDVPGQVFQGGLIFRKDAVPAEDLDPGMTPVGKHADHCSCAPAETWEAPSERTARAESFRQQRAK